MTPVSADELKIKLDEALSRIASLESELQAARSRAEAEAKRAAELASKLEAAQARGDGAPARTAALESAVEVAPLNEADQTLRRLIQRIAMILQAEKILIMFYDPETGELKGIPPAYGIPEEHLVYFRQRATQGVSGLVFREAEPAIFHDAATDARTLKDPYILMHVQNGVLVPLVIEKRDEENRVIERNTIGVLHAFNKRHGEDFNDEDVRLLERMARNVGSIIANLQLYREVVEEREELLQTFESLAAGLVVVSNEGKLSQMNATARTIFGARSDVIGKPFDSVITHPDVRALFERTLAGQELPQVEMPVILGGVERTYQVQAAQVRNEEGKPFGVVAIFSDITEIKNVERMKSSFVAMASHELRTPLTAIKGFVSTLLMDDSFTNEERFEFYQIIDQECDRLTRLINDLLNTARIEAGESLKPHYSEVNLTDLLEKVVMIQRQSTKRHAISLNIKGELPPIIGDQDKLDQILTNLLNNAIKYSPNGGDIIVHASVDGDHILIGVQDHGMGIPPEHLPRIFEKFHRVNNEDNRKIYGTGLGLYLVKHLVESIHLGKIWVESQVGVGSTFWFKIPIKLDVKKALELND